MANPSSLGVLLKKLQFQGKLFTSTFLQAAVADPILGIDFLRKFKGTQSNTVCLFSTGPARPYFAFSGSARLVLFV